MMQLPARIPEIIDALVAIHPELANGSDDQRRELVTVIGEQVCFELGPRWGNKKRTGLDDTGRSKDSIAYLEDDGTCSVWDWQSGASRQRVINAGDEPSYAHLPTNEAAFMPLTSINHLIALPPLPTGAPNVAALPGTFASFDVDVRAAIARLEASDTRVEGDLADVQEMLGWLVRRAAAQAAQTPAPLPAAPLPPVPVTIPATPIALPAGVGHLDSNTLGEIVKVVAALVSAFGTRK